MSDEPGIGANDEGGERERFLTVWRKKADSHTPTTITRSLLNERDINQGMRRIAIFSVGNTCEAHGPALPCDIDDRTGWSVATKVANLTGARYFGHIPYATDGLEVAAQWSPVYLPPETFAQRTTNYLRTLIDLHCEGDRPRIVVIISGHGGNDAIVPFLEEMATALDVVCCAYYLGMIVPQELEERGLAVQHAGDVEHAFARHLGPGCLDEEALAALNEGLTQDRTFLETIARYPALGGMAGFYILGSRPFDVIRGRYPGLKKTIQRFEEKRRVTADPAIGDQVFTHTVQTISERIRDLANDSPHYPQIAE